jgi:predicted XRE-type DNA-binding protein
MKRKNKKETPHLTKGDVLDDLGFSPAEALELKVKAEIYYELLEYIKEQGFTQQELGALLGIHQPDVSYLLNGRVSKFSVGKLIKFAGKLNLGTEVKITRPKASKSPAPASAKPQKRMSALA